MFSNSAVSKKRRRENGGAGKLCESLHGACSGGHSSRPYLYDTIAIQAEVNDPKLSFLRSRANDSNNAIVPHV